jgi:hypothetical protein
MTEQRKPKLLVDFDGVIHAYRRGWADGTAYDPPKPGAWVAIRTLLARGYDLVVFSTRPAEQIVPWLERYGFPPLRVTDRKEPAVALIDDRAIRFEDWDTALAEVLDRYPAPAPPVDEVRSTYAADEPTAEQQTTIDRIRRETAAHVLDRVRAVHRSAGDLSIPARFSDELDHIGRDFGVEVTR